MVTGPIRSSIRTKLRASSKHAWCSRAVQGPPGRRDFPSYTRPRPTHQPAACARRASSARPSPALGCFPAGMCTSNVSLHWRGQCRWNMGAHPIYRSDAVSAPDLCPDCWTSYAQNLSACPRCRRVPPLPGDLLNHMCALTESCHPAAGSAATLVPELRLRRVAPISHSYPWAVQHGCPPTGALARGAGCRRAILGQASRALCVEGRAFYQEGDLCPIPR